MRDDAARAQRMEALYALFLDDLLALVKSGKVKASDRAVIRQFLRDHDMAAQRPRPSTLQALVDRLPHFGDDPQSGD